MNDKKYLDKNFNYSKLTRNELRNILLDNSVYVKATARKPEILEIYRINIHEKIDEIIQKNIRSSNIYQGSIQEVECEDVLIKSQINNKSLLDSNTSHDVTEKNSKDVEASKSNNSILKIKRSPRKASLVDNSIFTNHITKNSTNNENSNIKTNSLIENNFVLTNSPDKTKMSFVKNTLNKLIKSPKKNTSSLKNSPGKSVFYKQNNVIDKNIRDSKNNNSPLKNENFLKNLQKNLSRDHLENVNTTFSSTNNSSNQNLGFNGLSKKNISFQKDNNLIEIPTNIQKETKLNFIKHGHSPLKSDLNKKLNQEISNKPDEKLFHGQHKDINEIFQPAKDFIKSSSFIKEQSDNSFIDNKVKANSSPIVSQYINSSFYSDIMNSSFFNKDSILTNDHTTSDLQKLYNNTTICNESSKKEAPYKNKQLLKEIIENDKRNNSNIDPNSSYVGTSFNTLDSYSTTFLKKQINYKKYLFIVIFTIVMYIFFKTTIPYCDNNSYFCISPPKHSQYINKKLICDKGYILKKSIFKNFCKIDDTEEKKIDKTIKQILKKLEIRNGDYKYGLSKTYKYKIKDLDIPLNILEKLKSNFEVVIQDNYIYSKTYKISIRTLIGFYCKKVFYFLVPLLIVLFCIKYFAHKRQVKNKINIMIKKTTKDVLVILLRQLEVSFRNNRFPEYVYIDQLKDVFGEDLRVWTGVEKHVDLNKNVIRFNVGERSVWKWDGPFLKTEK